MICSNMSDDISACPIWNRYLLVSLSVDFHSPIVTCTDGGCAVRDTLWFNLEPTEWRSSIRSSVGKKYDGRVLQVVCSFIDGADIQPLNTHERLPALTVHMSI